MRATISLLRNGFEVEAVTFGYPRERVFRQGILRHFDGPPAYGGDPGVVDKYQRVP